MGKRLITAVDVREAAQAGQMTLSTPSDACIVTPMAVEEANRLGIDLRCDGNSCPETAPGTTGAFALSSAKLIREVCDRLQTRMPAGTPKAKLENIIREVVYAKLGQADTSHNKRSQPISNTGQGVRFIDHQRLIGGQDGSVQVDEKMFVAEGISGKAGEKLAGGFMVWEKASFERRVEQPEIAVVLEGELHLDVDGHSFTGKPGDMVYFPKGAVVAYSASARVKLACINCV